MSKSNSVPQNKLNITDNITLSNTIESTCKIKTLTLDINSIPSDLDFYSIDFLKFVHYYLFRDIFESAGNFKRLNKDSLQLYPLLQIERALVCYFKDYKTNKNFSSLIELFSFICIFEPFEEGNNIVARTWLDLILAKFHNCSVNWTVITKDHFLKAILSANYDTSYIKYLLEQNLIKPPTSIAQRFVLTDASYKLSGLLVYKSADLYKPLKHELVHEPTVEIDPIDYINQNIDVLFQEALNDNSY